MQRWVMLGGALMLAAWLPFVYAELSSEPVTTKARPIYGLDKDNAPVAAGPSADSDKPAEPAPTAEAAPVPAEPASPAVPVEAVPAPHPVATAPAPSGEVAPSASARPDSAAPAPASAEHTEAAEPEAPSAAGPVDALKHAYETQPRDALWASDTEARVGALFGSKEIPAEMLKNASCRRAVCRVKLNWSAETAPGFVALNQRIAPEFGPELAIAPIASHDGEDVREVDLYLLRKGFTVADLAK